MTYRTLNGTEKEVKEGTHWETKTVDIIELILCDGHQVGREEQISRFYY